MPTKYHVVSPKTPVIDLTALWHIVVVSVAAGCGLAIAFGLILLGGEIVERRRNDAGRAGGLLLSGVAAAFCIAAIAVGIYAMLHPAKSKPNKVEPVAALDHAAAPAA